MSHHKSRMTVVSIEGDMDASSWSDVGPKFLRQRVNLEGRYSSHWFILPIDDEPPRVGDVYDVSADFVVRVPTGYRVPS